MVLGFLDAKLQTCGVPRRVKWPLHQILYLVSYDVTTITFYHYCHPNLILIHPNANHLNKVLYIPHPTILVLKCCQWNMDEKETNKVEVTTTIQIYNAQTSFI
jgi:hypothetical protein